MRARPLSLGLAALVAAAAAVAPAAAAQALPAHPVAAATKATTPLTKAQSWAYRTYGSFAVKTVHGSGDDVVSLPKHLRAAVVTASTNGQENFAIETLDTKNHEQDLLVNTIGAYSGADGFGLDDATTATKLQITADSGWTITIRPVWRTTLLPSSHTGDGVYLYDHSAGSMRFTNAGPENFAVQQYTGRRFGEDLLVNTIGRYRGTVPFSGGPTVFAVTSDGRWTAART